MIKYKSLSEDDVWFSFASLNDEQSITLTFLVLTFEVREQLQPYLEI